MLINFRKENIHHACFLVGDFILEDISQEIGLILDVEIFGNPDFQVSSYDTLTIDTARDLAEASGRKDFGSEKKIFVIKTNVITEEAQNALLKVFEEPTDATYFFIVMPQDILLPTLRSRVQIIKGGENIHNIVGVKNILNKSIGDRLEMVKEITDGISDEEKTKQDAISLLNSIELEIYSGGVEKFEEKLKVCELTRVSLYNRGAPVKMILENLMLSV